MPVARSLANDLRTIPADTAELVAKPLIAGLVADLSARIGAAALDEFEQLEETAFSVRFGGDLLLLVEDDVTVAGGAYRRYDSTTAQLDWLWTRPDRRRRGLALRVVTELETSAIRASYQRTYAVAGPGQTEVRGLLRAGGYRPLGSTRTDSDHVGSDRPGSGPGSATEYLSFVKAIGDLA
jgi:GNAT superfamily N-acetyltransferase